MARAPREHSRGSERAAFEKLRQGLRYGIEASTELSLLRDQKGFIAVAMTLERTLQLVDQLSIKGRIEGLH